MCTPRKANDTELVVCELGNPMKNGAQVRHTRVWMEQGDVPLQDRAVVVNLHAIGAPTAALNTNLSGHI